METNPRERVDVDERRTRFNRLRTGSGEAAAAEADPEPQQRQRANGGVNGKGRNRKQNVIICLFEHAVMTCDDLINNALRLETVTAFLSPEGQFECALRLARLVRGVGPF